MKYFAHSPKDGIEAEPYAVHVTGVWSLAKQYAKEAGKYAVFDGPILQQLAEKSAQYHDLGKLDPENQRVLSGEVAARTLPVNHVDAGAAHWLSDQQFSAFSAAAIQAHHIGFPDFSEEQNKGEMIFRDTEIAVETDKQLPDFEAIHKSLINLKQYLWLLE